jgi:ABC-2 type transport system permease protein
MRSGPIRTELSATFKVFLRSKGALFWTIVFPVLLIVIFGAIFSNSGVATHTVYVQNLDGGADSLNFIDTMNATHSINVITVDPDVDASGFIKDHAVSSYLIIPKGFGQALTDPSGSVSIDLRLDASSSSAAVAGIISNVANTFNLQIANGHEYVTMAASNAIGSNFGYMDFFLPGVIGLMIMQNSVYFISGTWIEGKTSGIFKKLVTTPMTRGQWLMAKLLFELVIIMMSIGVIFLTGALLYGVQMTMTWPALLMVILGSGMFAGLGMMIIRFSGTGQSSYAALSAITFTMMFLSGSFFPLDQMPSYLRTVASVMPLTYVNNGLRDAMVYGNEGAALVSLAIVAVLFAVFFVAGIALTSWKEDGEGPSLRERLLRKQKTAEADIEV